MNVLDKLKRFLEHTEPRIPASTWIKDRCLKAYVRRAYSLINGKAEFVLTIANIEVLIPHRGHGKNFIREAHKSNPFGFTYIENVCNEHLQNFLASDGWTAVENRHRLAERMGLISYYKATT